MKKVSYIAVGALLWLSTSFSAFAQPSQFIPATKPSNLPDTGDFGILFTSVINYFLGLVGLIAVLMLVIGGLRYVSAAGNEEILGKAKNTILYAIIGIIVVVISFALVFTLTSTLKTF